MSKIILLSVLLFSAGAFADDGVEGLNIKRLANKCWNTKLTKSQLKVCSKCEASVDEKYETSCSSEIGSADYISVIMEMVADDDDVYAKIYPLWSKALILRDNCKTEMINSCFLKKAK
ncbi:MAG: hypothetical protein ACRBBP_00950 [Bdellovibrionales bacterium]